MPDTPLLQQAPGLRLAGWPTRCAVCRGAALGRCGRLCPACRAAQGRPAWRCAGCGRPGAGTVTPQAARCGSCLRQPPPWAGLHVAVDYAPPWDRLIAAFKFEAAPDLAPTLVDALAGVLDGQPLPGPAPPLLLPMPLSAARLRERGYNQASLLARGLARRFGLALGEDLLLRVIDHPSQRGLDRAARAANVRGAFLVRPEALPRLRRHLPVLVDDVITTGATLAEACRSLHAAGLEPVQAWVLARTPEPGAGGPA